MTQEEVLEILKTGVNAFLTGAPGTGKTHTINSYIKWLKSENIEPSITASTGIAATHIKGRTLHSFLGLGIGDYDIGFSLEIILQKEAAYKRLNDCKVLIVDEVSMLEAKMINILDLALKQIKISDKPFGGIQVIFVGDFFQLPPVSRNNDIQFAFEAVAWKEGKLLICYLQKQYRQGDADLLDILLSIRNRSITENHINILDEIVEKTRIEGEDLDMTKLYTHNANVDLLNDAKIDELETDEFVFTMNTYGAANHVKTLTSSCLAPENLKLKVGARVMFVKNDISGEYVNGSIGQVVHLSKSKIKVSIIGGQVIEVLRADWSLEEEGKIKARLDQYPLRLAWAITVHKSQGMTLSEVYMSLEKTFEYGQGYVALSRAANLSGLYLSGYNQKALEINPKVFTIDKQLQKNSKLVLDKFTKSSKKKIKALQTEFINRNKKR